MGTIKNTEIAVRIIGRWHPSDMAIVRALHYQVLQDRSSASLEIEFIANRRDQAVGGWPSANSPWYTLVIRFEGVRDLQLKQFGGGETQIMGFDVTDISDRSWEGINYLVEDYEDGRLRFICKDVEILKVEPI
jgi:hypothetical protein